MDYEGRICRSPMEKASYMLPVAVGCSHNKCKFCMLFKHLQYRVLPTEQVFAEIDRVAAVGGKPKRVFLGDGNAFSLSARRIEEIVTYLKEKLPSVENIGMDSHAKNILDKTPEELKHLRSLGVTDFYLGIECGLEDVLEFLEKGNTLAEAEEAIRMLHDADMYYDAHIMTGICGKGRGVENGKALAQFFNRTKPHRICNFSLFFHTGSELYQEYLQGKWQPADELENLMEELALLENMEDFPCQFEGMHDFVQFRNRGNWPKDKDKMLDKLRKQIKLMQDEPERNFVAICDDCIGASSICHTCCEE